MNTNLIHNILNIVIAVLGIVTTVLIATGCVQAADGTLSCAGSSLNPKWTAIILTGLAGLKTVINVVRDGIGGLAKEQPPVQ